MVADMAKSPIEELTEITAEIVGSGHARKIIVAGAGAGKTTTFGKLLSSMPAAPADRRLVITFLGGLRRDLEGDLGDQAHVQTFHGYCFSLLKQSGGLRAVAGFSDDLAYEPRIGQLIRSDWAIVSGTNGVAFVPSLRSLEDNDVSRFFLARGSYYDVVGYDDSTVQVHNALSADPGLVPTYDLIIVDEFQDLNAAEVAVIELLSSQSSIVIAGDDDQALYGNLRNASEEHIRAFYARSDYSKYNLPYCMRCPAVVVEATNDIIRAADEAGHLGKRIQKRYDPFPRAELDARYPTIRVVKSSVQTPKANLFGKYILREILSIPENEISESLEKGFPTVLIIGSKPYSEQVQAFLEENGIRVEAKDRNRASVDDPFTRNDGFAALKANDRSNIGWRILLEIDRPKGCESWITASIETGAPLCELIDATFCDEIFGELETWTPPDVEDDAETSNEATENVPTVRLTSFEGAKGMSAQHVFVLGLEDGRFPADRNRPRTLDVRRMIVALTRTRKQCHLLRVSQRFSRKGRQLIRQSVFMDWIQPGRKDEISIKANDFKA